MNMQLNIPRHIHAEQPHPCVLKLQGLKRDDLHFGRKFYEAPPDRMGGSLAESLRIALHTSLTAVVFEYKDDAEDAVGDLVPLRPLSCTSLPHADLSLRLLAMDKQRPSATLFTSRKDGLSALLEAWKAEEVEDTKLVSAYQQLGSFINAPQPMDRDLYDSSKDPFAEQNRRYLNAWWQFIKSDPKNHQKVFFEYVQRVYGALGENAYVHFWDSNSYVLFSPYGLHSKRSTDDNALMNQDPPLQGKEVYVSF